MTRPNNGSVTRWGGVIDIYIWVACVINGLVEYAEPIGCAHSDDGTTYNVHKLTDEENLICFQMAACSQPLQVCIP